MELRDIKNKLESLEEVSLIVNDFEKSSILHNKDFLKEVSGDTPMKIKLINSALKEKQEITERLNSLAYNLGLLRSTILTKDVKTTKKIIHEFLRSEYSSIYTIAGELNDFKLKINSADENYRKLIGNAQNSLDCRINASEEYEKYLKQLNVLHNKQKELFVNMSGKFIKLAKCVVDDKRLRV